MTPVQPHQEILVVHAHGAAWHDFIAALSAEQMHVQTASSPALIAMRMQNRPPDVVLLDGQFEHGIDLLLNARQTSSGTLIIVVRKSRNGEGLYDATFPGASPRYIEPLPAGELAHILRESLLKPSLPAYLGGTGPGNP